MSVTLNLPVGRQVEMTSFEAASIESYSLLRLLAGLALMVLMEMRLMVKPMSINIPTEVTPYTKGLMPAW